MRLLLDTNIALWAVTDDSRLGGRAAALICEPANAVWVSVASLWEIAIKHALRRDEMPVNASDARRYFVHSGYRLLMIEPEHVIRVESLPQIHRDPFDRLMVSQALEEDCRLLTRDGVLPRYSELVLAV